MKFIATYHRVACLLCMSLAFQANAQTNTNSSRLTRESVIHAEKLIGLDFSNAKIDSMLGGLQGMPANYELLRKAGLSNSIPPALWFNPMPVGLKLDTTRRAPKWSSPGRVKLPSDENEIAFLSVGELGALIKSRKLTSERLTRLYLERLKKFGPRLECVITLTEELALEQARRADREIAAGKHRGPLHGIPYGAKDLLAAKGYKTTWGSVPFKDQVIEQDAAVVQRLEAAGAVLVAKLTMGELAWDDVWFGGRTRNPWNPEQGSSGSSAGSASATAAGLVAFGIGTETSGSIVSPATRCGVTGLRPTYGRVSRTGAMALTWTMDKIGPLCRTVEDCALVFNAIYGPDGVDQSVFDLPFNYQPKLKLSGLRIGYLKREFDAAGTNKPNDSATLDKLRALGAKLVPVELPKAPMRALNFILIVEMAAAFDDLTRSGQDELLVRPSQATSMRRARFVPAVEYLQANRVRYLLIQDMAKLFDEVDLFLAPVPGGDTIYMTNLTGHPSLTLPNGFNKDGTPTSVSFIGKLFGEAELLGVAKAYQDATDFHLKHPPMEKLVAPVGGEKAAAEKKGTTP